MELDADKLLEHAIRDGIREGIKSLCSRSYDNPIDKLLKDALERQGAKLRTLLDDCIGSCMADAQFRADIATQVRHQLAKTLVQRFGGELEKQVNVLKSDPATRARITLAIEEIVKERTVR